MTLEEGIKFAEYESVRIRKGVCKEWIDELRIESSAKRFEQLADWLRELKVHREIHDVLLQFIVDSELDICCDDLMDDEKEQTICEENCNDKSKRCWVRWAKLKVRETKADDR